MPSLGDFPHLERLLGPGVERLLSLGIEPELTTRPLVDSDQLDAFNAEFRLVLPESFRHIYAETDGFDISWRDGRDCGSFTCPTLYELRLFRQRWMNSGFPKDRTAWFSPEGHPRHEIAPLWDWLPFEDSGGGDLMCVDCTTGQVVMFDHETLEPSGSNGAIFADSLTQYIERCGSLCFPIIWCAHLRSCSDSSERRIDWTSSNVPHRFVLGGH